MKKSGFDYVVLAAGLLLIGAGLFLLKGPLELESLPLALPYLCIGVGCGAFGHGTGSLIGRRALKRSPDLQRQMEIEQGDERNVAISSRAKAKAYDVMIFAFGALMLAFALMGVDLTAVLLLVFTYLLVVGSGIYFRCKLEKEM